jgi:nitroreductase
MTDNPMTTDNAATDLATLQRLAFGRRATRHFKPDPIPDGLIDQLIEIARWAPSGYNLQPTHFVVVTDPAVRERLYAACLDQAQIREAPAVIVLTGDRRVAKNHFEDMLTLEREAGSITPEYEALLRWTIPLAFGTGPFGLGWLWKATLLPLVQLFRPIPTLPVREPRFWLAKQVMLCAMSLMLAAEAAGLASVPMEGFDEKRVRKVLHIPGSQVVTVVIAVGYAVPREARKTRLPIERVIHRDRW